MHIGCRRFGAPVSNRCLDLCAVSQELQGAPQCFEQALVKHGQPSADVKEGGVRLRRSATGYTFSSFEGSGVFLRGNSFRQPSTAAERFSPDNDL
ncbi:hypothetical protein MTO96_049078 [Rhipicephalus appendiculatus]